MKAIHLSLTFLFLFGSAFLLHAQDHSALSVSKQTDASYYYAKTVDMDFDVTVQKVKASLKEQGFGVVSEINMQEKLKKGAGKDIPAYLILGACHPASAYKAMQMEERIGVMLPCNVIVRETSSGRVEVASINPEMTMKSIGNPKMEPLAEEISAKLQKAIDNL
jgi:uncharacterized protein (DUF302 family)